MALIKCPECGKDVSDKAPACIHCGYPLEDVQQKAANTIPQQAPQKATAESSHSSLGFSAVAFEGNTVSLQCEKCKRTSDYLQNAVLTRSYEKEWVTNNTICCPSCGNTMRKGLKVKFIPQKPATAKSNQQPVTSQNKDENSGCLVWLIIMGLIVVAGMWLLTDGFTIGELWWLVFPLTFAVLLLGGMLYSFVTSDPKEVKDNWDKEKYNDYKFTCPMCGSKKVKKIDTMNRAASVAAVGLASSKIGKQYECDSCKHKW